MAWVIADNKLKHQRLTEQENATLLVAVNATTSLFLAILSSEHYRYGVEAPEWLSSLDAVAQDPKVSPGEGWFTGVYGCTSLP